MAVRAPTEDELFDDFLAAQTSPRTRRAYRNDLRAFAAWLGERGIGLLDAQRPDVDRFRNFLTEPVDGDRRPSPSGSPRYAPATVARRLSAVRAFYGYLTDRRLLGASPAAGVKGPRVAREPRGHGLTEVQAQALLDAGAQAGPQEDALVSLLLLSGLRVHEVCRAQVEDLIPEPGGGLSLRVVGKGAKVADVALNARAERAVRAVAGARTSGPLLRRKDRRRADAPLRPWSSQAAWRTLGELARRAGLTDADGHPLHVHPHKLRHSFVGLLLDAGIGLAAVQDAARHASADTTRRYDRQRARYREHPTHRLDLH